MHDFDIVSSYQRIVEILTMKENTYIIGFIQTSIRRPSLFQEKTYILGLILTSMQHPSLIQENTYIIEFILTSIRRPSLIQENTYIIGVILTFKFDSRNLALYVRPQDVLCPLGILLLERNWIYILILNFLLAVLGELSKLKKLVADKKQKEKQMYAKMFGQ